MFKENIPASIREFIQKDDTLTDPNTCRDSVLKIKKYIEENFPIAETILLAYPDTKTGENVHYSLLARLDKSELVINTVKAPGFPFYIGDLDHAIPTFLAMKKVPNVI